MRTSLAFRRGRSSHPIAASSSSRATETKTLCPRMRGLYAELYGKSIRLGLAVLRQSHPRRLSTISPRVDPDADHWQPGCPADFRERLERQPLHVHIRGLRAAFQGRSAISAVVSGSPSSGASFCRARSSRANQSGRPRCVNARQVVGAVVGGRRSLSAPTRSVRTAQVRLRFRLDCPPE